MREPPLPFSLSLGFKLGPFLLSFLGFLSFLPSFLFLIAFPLSIELPLESPLGLRLPLLTHDAFCLLTLFFSLSNPFRVIISSFLKVSLEKSKLFFAGSSGKVHPWENLVLAWHRICFPTSEGGLGLKSFTDWNKSLIFDASAQYFYALTPLLYGWLGSKKLFWKGRIFGTIKHPWIVHGFGNRSSNLGPQLIIIFTTRLVIPLILTSPCFPTLGYLTMP